MGGGKGGRDSDRVAVEAAEKTKHNKINTSGNELLRGRWNKAISASCVA